MITLIEKLKNDQLINRKQKNTIVASLLTVLYSEAINVGKNSGNRLPTDNEVIDVIKKMVKSNKQNIEIYSRTNKLDALELAEKELAVLNEYLPKTPSIKEVKDSISEIMLKNKFSKESATMGKIMKELKLKYGSSLDGSVTSQLIKDFLST